MTYARCYFGHKFVRLHRIFVGNFLLPYLPRVLTKLLMLGPRERGHVFRIRLSKTNINPAVARVGGIINLHPRESNRSALQPLAAPVPFGAPTRLGKYQKSSA